ncbi:MAG: phosphatase PAP2 family protein [Promethearchaeota archaeon]|jgi:membrane-associated phospholipid phosphatase
MELSKSVKLLITILVIWIVLAILFGIYDLEISIALVDEESNWGNFGADYGEVPGYALIAIALATFLGSYIKNIKKQKILIIFAVITGVIYLLLGIFDNDNTDISLGISLIILPMLYLITTWNKDWKKYRKIASIISILAIINPLLIVQLIKLFWGRVRFRDLAVGYTNFTPWFRPLGITGNFSFPSGHTAMGWMFLPLLISVKSKETKFPLKLTLLIGTIGWGVFVAMSRVIVGAHYASDVLFSSAFAAVITNLLYRKIYLRNI